MYPTNGKKVGLNMVIHRKPFQGVLNIIRFNWHFFLFSFLTILLLFFLSSRFDEVYNIYFHLIISLIILPTAVSLIVSYYVYDTSELYSLSWLEEVSVANNTTIVNVNAGFDETSFLLQQKFKNSKLRVLDFYDSEKHTEISIKRARKAYPVYPNTIKIKTSHLPLPDNSTQLVFGILSTHEIRSDEERIEFFKEINRILHSEGELIIVEHLCNPLNFLAYNIGVFHFHSNSTWKTTFAKSNLSIKKEFSITPFLKGFILCDDGNSN